MSVAVKLFITFLVFAGVAIAIFIVIAVSTKLPPRDQREVQRRGYAIRGWWFMGLFLFVIAAFAASVPFYPYMSATAALAPARKVPVIAEQYAFIMPSHLPVNTPIIMMIGFVVALLEGVRLRFGYPDQTAGGQSVQEARA